MRKKSWLGHGKYSKKVLYEKGTSDWTFAATKQKNLLKAFPIVGWTVMVWSLRLIIGESFVVFLERNYGFDSFPGIFHVIDIIFKVLAIVFFFALF